MLKENRTLVLWTLISFLACAWMPFVNHSRWGDMSDWFTDHVHHPFATWVALKKGTQIYTRPFAEIWNDTGYPHEVKAWGEMPMAYPPGVFVTFLPTMFIGLIPMSDHAFGVINALYMTLLGHLAFLAALLLLKELPRGSRAATGMMAWIVILTLSLNGFYDPVFIGAGAMMLRALARDEPEKALNWLSLGALLHFRMAAFAPFAAYALWRIFQRRKERPLPWKSLVFLGVAAAICVGTFALMYPATAQFRATHPPVLRGQGKDVVIALSLLAAGACAVLADVWVALAVLTCLALSIVETQNYFWHAAILLAPMLGVGAIKKTPREPSIARSILIAWSFALGPLVWQHPLTNLFSAFAQVFKF